MYIRQNDFCNENDDYPFFIDLTFCFYLQDENTFISYKLNFFKKYITNKFHLPFFCVINDEQIRQLLEKKICSLSQLIQSKIINKLKIYMYGDLLIDVINYSHGEFLMLDYFLAQGFNLSNINNLMKFKLVCLSDNYKFIALAESSESMQKVYIKDIVGQYNKKGYNNLYEAFYYLYFADNSYSFRSRNYLLEDVYYNLKRINSLKDKIELTKIDNNYYIRSGYHRCIYLLIQYILLKDKYFDIEYELLEIDKNFYVFASVIEYF